MEAGTSDGRIFKLLVITECHLHPLSWDVAVPGTKRQSASTAYPLHLSWLCDLLCLTEY